MFLMNIANQLNRTKKPLGDGEGYKRQFSTQINFDS